SAPASISSVALHAALPILTFRGAFWQVCAGGAGVFGVQGPNRRGFRAFVRRLSAIRRLSGPPLWWRCVPPPLPPPAPAVWPLPSRRARSLLKPASGLAPGGCLGTLSRGVCVSVIGDSGIWVTSTAALPPPSM